MSNCITDIKTINKFLNLTGGNWRFSIYIQCKCCKYPHEEGCGDYLCAFDENAYPVFLPLCDCNVLFHRYIDPSECLLWISQYSFFEIYNKMFPRDKDDMYCPFLQKAGSNW